MEVDVTRSNGIKVLVTGAAGFIGAHAMKVLIDAGLEVVGIDSFNDYYSMELKRKRIAALGVNQKVHACEIGSGEFRAILQDSRPAIVMHLAAQPGVRFCQRNPMSYVQANVIEFENLLIAMKDYGLSRLLYASSSSIYGSPSPEGFIEANRGDSVSNLYALTKRYNEDRVLIERDWLNSTGLRFFSVYGPWGRPDMAYMRLAAAVRGLVSFTQFGDGNQRRDYTFIDDITRILVKLVQKNIEVPILNLGGGHPVSLNEIRALFQDLSNSQNFELEKASQDKTESLETRANTGLLRELDLPIPSTRVGEGIAVFWNWINEISDEELHSWIASSK